MGKIRVAGHSVAELDELRDHFALLVETALHTVATSVAASLSDVVTAATDPTHVQLVIDQWNAQVSANLAPFVAATYESGALAVGFDLAHSANLPPGQGIPAVSHNFTESYLAQATNRLKGIGDDLWGTIQQELIKGQQAGESIDDIARRVQNAAGVTNGRALRIARTEIIAASNAGSYAQAKLVADEGDQKEWVATLDNRTRIDHVHADGQVVPLDQPFIVGGWPLMYPGEIGAPASEVVNCRCTLTYVYGEITKTCDCVGALTSATHLPGKSPITVASESCICPTVPGEHTPAAHYDALTHADKAAIYEDFKAQGSISPAYGGAKIYKHLQGIQSQLEAAGLDEYAALRAIDEIYLEKGGKSSFEQKFDEWVSSAAGKKATGGKFAAPKPATLKPPPPATTPEPTSLASLDADAVFTAAQTAQHGEVIAEAEEASGKETYHYRIVKLGNLPDDPIVVQERIGDSWSGAISFKVFDPAALKNGTYAHLQWHAPAKVQGYVHLDKPGMIPTLPSVAPATPEPVPTMSAADIFTAAPYHPLNGVIAETEPDPVTGTKYRVIKTETGPQVQWWNGNTWVSFGVPQGPDELATALPSIKWHKPTTETAAPTPTPTASTSKLAELSAEDKAHIIADVQADLAVSKSYADSWFAVKNAAYDYEITPAEALDIVAAHPGLQSLKHALGDYVKQDPDAHSPQHDPPKKFTATAAPGPLPPKPIVEEPPLPSSAPTDPLAGITKSTTAQWYQLFKDTKPVTPGWGGSAIFKTLQQAKAELKLNPGLATELDGLTDEQLIKLLDQALANQDKTGAKTYLGEVGKWADAPAGKKAGAKLGTTAHAPAPHAPVPAATGEGADITHVPEAAQQEFFTKFKNSGTYLSSTPSTVYAKLRELIESDPKFAGLTDLQALKILDSVGAKKLGVPDKHLYEKKIVDWLATPQGKKAALEAHMSPEEKAALAKKAAEAALKKQAEDAKKLAELEKQYAMDRSTIPEFDPAVPSSSFSTITVQTAQKMQNEMLAEQPWTTTQKRDLTYYTGSNYTAMNRYLREGGSASPRTREAIAGAQAGMRPSTRPILVQRGTGFAQFGVHGYEETVALVGKTLQDRGFMSTSVGGSAAFGGAVRLDIECPVGTPMAFVKSISHFKGENEMLLAAGHKYRVVSVTREGYQTVVRVRIVP